MTNTENVVILGSGPAGYTAALYAGRANLKPLLIEGEADASKRTELPGGQLMITTEVENYPGFPHADSVALAAVARSALAPDRYDLMRGTYEGKNARQGRRAILGPEMMELLRQQAVNFGARIETAWIDRVDFSKRPFRFFGDSGQEWSARTAIIATGASAKWLGIPSEDELRKTGYVSACATCDGALPHFRNKHLAVIGGGDSAIEEGTFLTKFASKVTIVHRRDRLRASKIMQDRARKNPKIAFQWNSAVSEVLDVKQKKVTGLKLKDTVNGKESTMPCEGLFLAIGHEPATRPFREALETDEMGYIKVRQGSTTSVPGVFAAGDCVDHVYRQAITAAGMGCMAAIDAERWLESHE